MANKVESQNDLRSDGGGIACLASNPKLAALVLVLVTIGIDVFAYVVGRPVWRGSDGKIRAGLARGLHAVGRSAVAGVGLCF